MSKELSKTNQHMQKLKNVLSADSVKKQFENSLKENAGSFIASIIDLYGSDAYLQQCDPNQVVMECLKAATLKLPINKQLGFAYIVPYRKNGVQTPQFQLGYKGYVQLAMRTGQYKHLNPGIVYEGVNVNRDLLTGQVSFTGEPTSDKAIGYFTYMELVNGFSKVLYMTKDEIIAHAKKYSKSYNNKSSEWKTDFDSMALKTTTRLLLSKYGILSVDMISGLSSDTSDDVETNVARDIEENANKETIDVDYEFVDTETEPEEPKQVTIDGPGF